jgi:Ala-tRNA(Pro) deacylase
MVAAKLQGFLEAQGVEHRPVPHAPAPTSSETAQAAHVPGARLAKAVVVEVPDHCAVVVLPATAQVHLGELRRILGETCALATEPTVAQLFDDCEAGSVPPFGQAYGLEVLVDDRLLEHDRVFVQSGDRVTLLELDGDDFRRLMKDARHGCFSHHPERHGGETRRPPPR